MSLISVNGVPANISTSRFCTTSPQNWNVLFLRARVMVVSPTIVSGGCTRQLGEPIEKNV